MDIRRPQGVATVAQLAGFDEIIDARSPAEFGEDHLPGAVNCPVLSDSERAHVGTIYKQVSPFEARKLGAVLVARNIAAHVEAHFLDKPRHWRPLVYCWRGGQRSGAFGHVLREIGWDAQRLEGGYKAWRREVLARLAELPARFRFNVVCGATGSGKSRILEAIARRGAQVLHLEALAAHKGSVLGVLPNASQPSQKAFETGLYSAILNLDASRPVFVEAESRKIGNLQVPDALIEAIRRGRCLRVDAQSAARVEFLLRDYDYYCRDAAWFGARIACLRGLQSNETLERWCSMADVGAWAALVGELLERHYDPLYRRSQNQNFAGFAAAEASFASDDLSPSGIEQLAERILGAVS